VSQTVQVAVVQAAAVGFDRDESLDKAARLAGQAAADGAQLVVFPEAFLSGYPRGMSFEAVVGLRGESGYDQFARYAASAVSVPGPAVDRLGEIAVGHGIHLVIGVVESAGGTLYCTVLFFAPDQGLLGVHRKLMPTQAERLLWGTGDGSTLPVFDTALGRLGAVICWENYMPLMRMAMYAKGIELYCAPTADGRDQWVASMQHIAIEGRCFVLAANQYSTRADFPSDLPNTLGDDPGVEISRGGSCIIDPFGRFLAGPVFGSETVLHAELDLALITQGKWDFDVVGHYARPDVFQLRVNEAANRPVTFDYTTAADADA
jgi:nitrilase